MDCLTIKQPEYFCEKHGKHEFAIAVDGEKMGDLRGYYCQICWVEELSKTCKKMTLVTND